MSRLSKFILLLAIVVIAGISGMFINENQDVFTGSKVKNSDCYILKFEKMNQTDTHQLELSAGDDISVDYGIERGTVNLQIGQENADPIYRGGGIKTDSFKVGVPEDGTYTVTIEAKNAAGYIMIYALKQE